MFSGKSEELIRRVRRAQIARQRVQVFKPALDDRYGRQQVASHDGSRLEAVSIARSEEILTHLQAGLTGVAGDEAPVLDEKLPNVAGQLAGRGLRVIAAGLYPDVSGEALWCLPPLIAIG